MAEENTQTEPQEFQPTEREQLAMEQGWVPKDEWSGDPEDWRPAKEFLDRGELFRKIDELKRENKSIRQGVEEFKKHHEQVKTVAYKQALADLRAQKKQALEEGNADAVVEIDDKIAETREAQREAEKPEVAPEPTPTQPNPEFTRWEARNSWYKSDRAMKLVADDVAREMVGRGITDVNQILVAVDREVRKEFPSKFENPNRSKAGAVEGSSKNTRSPTKDDVVMSDVEKTIMNKILRTGAITKEKYLEEFKKTRAG